MDKMTISLLLDTALANSQPRVSLWQYRDWSGTHTRHDIEILHNLLVERSLPFDVHHFGTEERGFVILLPTAANGPCPTTSRAGEKSTPKATEPERDESLIIKPRNVEYWKARMRAVQEERGIQLLGSNPPERNK